MACLSGMGMGMPAGCDNCDGSVSLPMLSCLSPNTTGGVGSGLFDKADRSKSCRRHCAKVEQVLDTTDEGSDGSFFVVTEIFDGLL